MERSADLRRVRVSAPATSANLGPGFDAIGVALALRGEVELSIADAPSASLDRGERMALAAAERVYRALGSAAPLLDVRIDSAVPAARGLGASAMLRAGAALAAATLAGVDLELDTLLGLVSELEGHADNAAPALLGGLQVVAWAGGTPLHVEVPLPDGLQAALFVPDFEMPTDESRRLLPETLGLRDAVHNAGRAALLVAALATGRLDLLDAATDDRLHQPARARLFPAMYDIFQAAKAAGARCAYLSGGGSTILALAGDDAERVAAAMAGAGRERGVEGRSLVTTFSRRGAEVVERA